MAMPRCTQCGRSHLGRDPHDPRCSVCRGKSATAQRRVAAAQLDRAQRHDRATRRACLRCDRAFESSGPHHRLCTNCRQAIAAEPSALPTYRFSR